MSDPAAFPTVTSALELDCATKDLQAKCDAYREALEKIRDRLEEHANNAFDTGLLTIAYNALSNQYNGSYK